MKKLDMVGKKFDRWIVIEDTGKNKYGRITYKCICSCGIEKIITGNSLINGKSKSCGCLRREIVSARMSGKNHPQWKGGRSEIKSGYVYMCNPKHPNSGKSGRVGEHVIVMCNHLGRSLIKGESVHHINGIKNNNKIENLELWSKAHPNGKRVSDLIDFSIDVLKIYNPEILKKINEK